MNFLEDINQKLKANDLINVITFKMYMIGNKKLYIFGIREVSLFTKDEIQFNIKNGKIIIFGENLSFDELSKSEAIVSGKIIKFEIV